MSSGGLERGERQPVRVREAAEEEDEARDGETQSSRLPYWKTGVFIRTRQRVFFLFGGIANGECAHSFERPMCFFVLQSSSEKYFAMSAGWPGQKVLVQSLGSNLAAEWLNALFLSVPALSS